MYVFMYVCMYVRMYVNMYVLRTYVCMYIYQWIPARHRTKRAVLVFSGNRDGYNLHTLYRQSEKFQKEKLLHRKGCESASLLLIKTDKKEVKHASS
jgi:hypothetical protein